MAVGNAYVFPGFLTPVLTQLSLQIPRLLFSHASAEVRIRRKESLPQPVSNLQPPGHESDTHSQLSRTRLIGTLAYQEIDEKIDVNRKSSGISGVWRTSTVCNR